MSAFVWRDYSERAGRCPMSSIFSETTTQLNDNIYTGIRRITLTVTGLTRHNFSPAAIAATLRF